jgi:hypothetical protein
LARASWVRSLRVLACSEPALPHFLARVPERLHTLEIAPSSSPLSTVVNHLATDPPPGLLALDLRDSRIDDEGLRRLGELDLPKLAAVTLPRRRSSFSIEAVQAFAQSRLGAQLTSLDTGLSEIDRLPAPPPIEVGYGEYTPLRLL